MEYLIVIVLSYLLGSLNPARLLTWIIKGEDIRKVNSKNPGASNATLTLGLKWGVVVFILDLLKGFVPVFVVKLLYPENDVLWVVAGVSAILGHVFPIFMGFSGGKGTSTFMGVAFGLFPLFGLMLLILLIVTTVVSDYVAVGTLFLLIPVPVIMYFKGYHWIGILIISLYIVLNIYKHKNNFIAIYKKEEKGLKESLKK